MVLHLNKFESQDALMCQICLKLAQWFWRRFKYFIKVFSLLLLSPLGKGKGHSFEQTWIHFTQGCFVPIKLVEIGPVVFGEEDFKILSMYFCYFEIISPRKKAGPFIWTNLTPLHQKMHCAKFGWYWPSGFLNSINFINLNLHYPRMHCAKFGWNRASGSV